MEALYTSPADRVEMNDEMSQGAYYALEVYMTLCSIASIVLNALMLLLVITKVGIDLFLILLFDDVRG